MQKETNAEFLARLHARVKAAEEIVKSCDLRDKTCPEDRTIENQRIEEIRARVAGRKRGPLPAKLRKTFRAGGSLRDCETAALGGSQEER